MKWSSSKRRFVLLLVLVVAILFVFRPGANGLRKRIVNSISMALGRRVGVQWVKIQVLPQPGFVLENFVVYDDPAFSAEPMLRADEVTANLRLRSLFRGRLEIGRLSLKEPSLNLVRNNDGHWNLASLVERAAHTPTTPTSHTRPEAHPVFPYIEADNARINFRIGAEKKAYTLTDADFALWLESENQWGMRLRAVPLRTDFNLTDTGAIRMNGSWLRSETLAETPLKVNVQWERAQLGQLTKLFYGIDKGWRGEVAISAVFSGTPANLQVISQASVQDFRRYDIVPTQSLRLATTCNASYSSVTHVVSQILCVAPVGNGILGVQGRVDAPTGPQRYDLTWTAQDLPIQSIVALARRAKKDLPQDLTATGTLNGELSLRSAAEKNNALEWSGKAETNDFRLRSNTTEAELSLGSVPIVLVAPSAPVNKNMGKRPSPALAGSGATTATIGPFNLALGKGHILAVRGSLNHAGYSFSLQGDAQVQRLLQAAQTLGLRAPQPLANGEAKVDLQISGAWAGFAAPLATGTAQLRSVRAEARGLDGPIDIDSATLVLTDSGVRVSKLAAHAAGTHWNGWLSFPRQCTSLPACPVRFDLQADEIAFALLHDWLIPQPRARPWYRFLAPSTAPGPPLLLSLNASGKLAAGHFSVQDIVANKLSADIDLQAGKLRMSDIQAAVLGGTHRGDWEADLSANPPLYAGKGDFSGIALTQVAAAMHDGWVSGTGSASYQFASHGKNMEDLLANAAFNMEFDARGGELAHLRLADNSTPLRLRRFTGRLTLRDGSFHLEQGKLDTPGGIYLVSGTASLRQKLDLTFTRDGHPGFNITGTLAAPHVVAVTAKDTRAALKP